MSRTQAMIQTASQWRLTTLIWRYVVKVLTYPSERVADRPSWFVKSSFVNLHGVDARRFACISMTVVVDVLKLERLSSEAIHFELEILGMYTP